MKMLRQIHASTHDKVVFGRRINVLATRLCRLLPHGSKVLDVGAGSGTLARRIMSLRPDVTIEGIDVLVRPDTDIKVTSFDGFQIPFEDNCFDAVLFVDVLHHAEDPEQLLREARRVADTVIIKDHGRDGFFAGPTLRFMDWIGNAMHGVALPYNYLSADEWSRTFAALGLKVEAMERKLDLYARPFSWIFDRKLHFIARLS